MIELEERYYREREGDGTRKRRGGRWWWQTVPTVVAGMPIGSFGIPSNILVTCTERRRERGEGEGWSE